MLIIPRCWTLSLIFLKRKGATVSKLLEKREFIVVSVTLLSCSELLGVFVCDCVCDVCVYMLNDDVCMLCDNVFCIMVCVLCVM